jgi:hypothetical protein
LVGQQKICIIFINPKSKEKSMAAQENKKGEAQTSTLKDGDVVVTQKPGVKREPEKVLFTWKAPSRPFKKRDKQFWTTVIVIASIFGLILFLVEGAMPVMVIISLIFLFYVLTTVEPEEIEYDITNYGIKMAGQTTHWTSLVRFWFTERLSSTLLIIETTQLPGRLELVINEKEEDKLREVISEYLPEEETPATAMDKTADWFAKKLPGNN